MCVTKKIDYEVNPEKKYPTYKTESGLDYKGIENTLQKPHGVQVLMEQIIKEVKKGVKQIVPFSKKLSADYSYSDIYKAIEIMVIDGILQTRSKNKKPNKSNIEWELQIIRLDPRVQDDICEKEDPFVTKYEELRNSVFEIIEKTKFSPLKEHLNQCINERTLSSPNGEKVCGITAWVKFRSIALTLAYSVVLLDEERQEPIRVISERIWGKSKILDRYKKDITLVAGKSISQLNLTSMPEVTFVHGDIIFVYNGYRSSFMAGSPCLLAESTIKGLEIEYVGVEKIFVVENLAAFQEVLARKYQVVPDVLIIWGAGYLSSTKLRLLKKILQFKCIPVYIWSDLDSDGLGLTLDIVKKVRAFKVNAYPVLMSANELDLAKGKYKASNHYNMDDQELSILFPDVIERIKSQNVIEQEELLLNFDLLKDKLP
jgi:hypothetical protein